MLGLIPAVAAHLPEQRDERKAQRPLQAAAAGVLTGFCWRSASCRTMDLDWLSRSAGPCGFLGRSCTAPPGGARSTDSCLELCRLDGLSITKTLVPGRLCHSIKATKRRAKDGGEIKGNMKARRTEVTQVM